VDNFARLPWDERTKSLFGRVDLRCRRHDFLAEEVNYSECASRHNAKPGFPATGVPDRMPLFLPPGAEKVSGTNGTRIIQNLSD
jgi:hypothetical protein